MTVKNIVLALSLCFFSTICFAQKEAEPFKGKLFAPNIILQHQGQLNLSAQQMQKLRQEVIKVQTSIAEPQWEMAEAYQKVIAEVDKDRIDETVVLENLEKVLLAENKVKKIQTIMLIRLRNLLTAEQIDYLKNAVDQ